MPSFLRRSRQISCALVCVAAFLAVGCHNHNRDSGYGIGWVTLTDSPGDFAAYQVSVDTLTLTGKANGPITVVGAVETVDFTKLRDISELWSAASVPNDTYTAASVVLDYSNANIVVIRNGIPVKAKVVDSSGAAPTTMTVNITLDPGHPLVIVPTYASTSAQRLAVNFDLAASNVVNLAPATPTVTVKPFITAATSAPDTKQVRIRGPLINSSVNVGTYTVYVRPFFDEVNSLGSLTLFTGVGKPTVYLINGASYVGADGIKALSQTSAGTTITAAYTTYQPTPDTAQATSAGKFNASYVVAGSTLEDYYTQGLEGDVVGRSGNSLTVRGATAQFNDGSSIYYPGNSTVLLGPKTIVTADNNPALTNLDYMAVAAGQHIIARGLYSITAAGVVTLDATGAASTNTGSVRLISTQLFGSLVSAGAGQLVLDLGSVGHWPAGSFVFDGNGAAPIDPANLQIDTGSLTLPTSNTGAPLWINGVFPPYGSAPPDFLASSISSEISVPARLQVDWNGAGTTTPFSSATSAGGLTVDLANTRLLGAAIRIGEESIDMKSLASSTKIVPVATPAATPGVPAVFLPLFSIGGQTAKGISTITSTNTFATFLANVTAHVVAATPAYHLVATGYYSRATNTFTANSVNIAN